MGTKLEIRQDAWTVGKLFGKRGQINLNPQWQRGPAWKQSRQVLLIDSILRFRRSTFAKGREMRSIHMMQWMGSNVFARSGNSERVP
ncbi:hypothetical protein DUT91_17085 [Phyllobacterium salinisoli]|uniref:DUF262 domain-containing protein n=1 Tax=Phyllobacterium salinisoli TaxID=1899321 RepID=A0A368K3M5_9HYPH|nr:hypothetical protein DUT91_17085 [Phyllobacterium salinisoli]